MEAVIKEDMGIANKLEHGLVRARDKLPSKHPLEISEQSFRANAEKAANHELRMVQGFAAPLHLQMEKAAIRNVGHLACITHRNRLQLDIIEGRDTLVDFDDLFGRPENCEDIRRPHDVIERALATGRL